MPMSVHHERGERYMPLPARSWTVSCRACDLVIGTVEDGHFVHDETCTKPLAIGAGLLRCCQCGGSLAGDPRPLAPLADAEPEPAVPVLQFRRPELSEDDVRQRL
jgi:hypothetical protein